MCFSLLHQEVHWGSQFALPLFSSTAIPAYHYGLVCRVGSASNRAVVGSENVECSGLFVLRADRDIKKGEEVRIGL